MSTSLLQASETVAHRLAPHREHLLRHPVYGAVHDVHALRIFARNHVFAVWDFMSLLKRLQRELAGTDLPWTPPRDANLARFVNEIVLAEESDTDGAGGHASHFALYLQAMQQLDADTAPIHRFLERLAAGRDPSPALEDLPVEPETRRFVAGNLRLATSGAAHEVAAAFCFGREDVIPEMFQRLLVGLRRQDVPCDRLAYYLQRHVEVDGDEHGPLARRLVDVLCADDPERIRQAAHAARHAVQARCRLWDGILHAVERESGR